jgi:hypothetical protein
MYDDDEKATLERARLGLPKQALFGQTDPSSTIDCA